MSETASLPILYSFRRCPYAMRARMAIRTARISVELREVVLSDKPQGLVTASAKGTVPVLVLPDGSVIDESIDIMRWALTCCDPTGWLDIDERAAHVLIERNDNEFKQNLDRYKYPQRFPEHSPEAGRTAGIAYLRVLDDQLDGSPCLFGEQISIVDIAVAPFVRQFAHVDPAWFSSSAGHSLRGWLARFEASTLFSDVMCKYPSWSSGDSPIFFGAG